MRKRPKMTAIRLVGRLREEGQCSVQPMEGKICRENAMGHTEPEAGKLGRLLGTYSCWVPVYHVWGPGAASGDSVHLLNPTRPRVPVPDMMLQHRIPTATALTC